MNPPAPMFRLTQRDLHGRGLRRPLLDPRLPAARTRAERFYDGVRAACARLQPRWGQKLEALRIVVEDVPLNDPAPWEAGGVPLARIFPSHDGLPDQVVLYRRPIETRTASERELGLAILDILVEQLAELWRIDPQEIDHGYR